MRGSSGPASLTRIRVFRSGYTYKRIDRREFKRPRLVVVRNYRKYCLTINEPIRWYPAKPWFVRIRDFKKLQEFVRAHRRAILRHWNLKTDSMGLIEELGI
jgi:hypothetical protein